MNITEGRVYETGFFTSYDRLVKESQLEDEDMPPMACRMDRT